MTSDLSISELITAMEVLEQRSLIESTKKIGKEEVQYGLEPVVRKYILVDPFGFVHNKNYTDDAEHTLNECA